MSGMIQYIPVVLICNSLLPATECKEGKRDVTIVLGEMQNTPMNCLKEGNERVARLAFAPKLGDNYYVKVRCVPKESSEFGR
jgi:hypothetical protein